LFSTVPAATVARMPRMVLASSTSVIRAAGGIVWRRARAAGEIAVVRRARYGEEWTLPKGKLRDGESWEDAAVREVQEETGCSVNRRNFAGGHVYEVGKRPKVVLFWHMSLLREGVIVMPDDEVRELRWLSPAAAQRRLTHPEERRVLVHSRSGSPLAVRQ
jgi:8-oxo-dGTP pyrophosphatase MutT (NUDIX family)